MQRLVKSRVPNHELKQALNEGNATRESEGESNGESDRTAILRYKTKDPIGKEALEMVNWPHGADRRAGGTTDNLS